MIYLKPKEKAENLATKMFNVQSKSPCSWSEAIKCAIIAVDEIIEALYNYGNESMELQNMDSEFRYWDSVKTELEKL
jgi:hypothetical protein